MHLYSLTLQTATAINQACKGSFSAPGSEEICVAKGKVIQIYRVDPETGKLELFFSQEMFGIIRSILAFRLIGMQRDFLVIGSDSGRIVILDYDQGRNQFVKLH